MTCYFTFIFIFAVLPLDERTVIVTIPFFLAVIFPFAFTEAIFGFEDRKISLSVAVSGVRVTFTVILLPFFNTADVFFRESFFAVTCPFCTVTLQEAFAPFLLTAVITAVPCFLDVSFPLLLSTFTTAVFEDRHSFMLSPAVKEVTFSAVVLFFT